LFITTGKEEYKDYLAPFFKGIGSNDMSMWWGGLNAPAVISLITVPNGLSEDEIETLKQKVVSTADKYLDQIEGEGYRVPLGESQYVWGSNSDVLNKAIVMSLAYDITEDVKYVGGATESMNYVLGRNANKISFVSGYGTNAMQHPHHRFWGNQPANGFPPPPPGAIAGGPNGSPADPDAVEAVSDAATAKRYIDVIGSYSTNEVAINWNAPLTWVAAYLDAHYRSAES
jgi:endoglucanase